MSYAALFSELATPAPAAAIPAGLSAAQGAVVTAPLTASQLVLAGPGSGKTRTLVARIEYLLGMGVRPDSILVCTFTRKAAQEMRERLAASNLLVPWLGTIHGLSLRMAGSRAKRILEDSARVSIMKEAPVALMPAAWAELDASERIHWMDRAREDSSVQEEALTELVEWYQAELDKVNAQDFLDLIEAVSRRPSRRFAYVLVDEAQDLTRLQLAWLEAICEPGAKRFLVGDDDQSIYAFRGRSSLPDMPKMFLTENYRSTVAIVTASQMLVRWNMGRIPKTVAAANGLAGDQPCYVCLDSEVEEWDAITNWSEEKQGSRAVLVRTRWMAERLRCLVAEAGLAVEVYTIHAAKGKEWDHVWLAGAEDKLLPLVSSDAGLQEERRLMYVAITRARFSFQASAVARRQLRCGVRQSKPSIFLAEAKLKRL